MATIAMQSATLLAAFHVSGVPVWMFRAAVGATVIACLSVAGVLIGSGSLDEAATRAVGLLLVLVAPAAIVMGAARHFRASGGVTLTTMFAVLCIYLLLGMAFAYVFGIAGAIQSEPFFAAASGGEPIRLPLLQLHHPDHDRVRRLHGRHGLRPLAGDHGGADRPDLPRHRGRADRRQHGAWTDPHVTAAPPNGGWSPAAGALPWAWSPRSRRWRA